MADRFNVYAQLETITLCFIRVRNIISNLLKHKKIMRFWKQFY